MMDDPEPGGRGLLAPIWTKAVPTRSLPDQAARCEEGDGNVHHHAVGRRRRGQVTYTPPLVAGPAANPWDTDAITSQALEVLRLDPSDMDAVRIATKAAEAVWLIDQQLDMAEPYATAAAIPTAIVGAAVTLTVELYKRKDAPGGITDSSWPADDGSFHAPLGRRAQGCALHAPARQGSLGCCVTDLTAVAQARTDLHAVLKAVTPQTWRVHPHRSGADHSADGVFIDSPTIVTQSNGLVAVTFPIVMVVDGSVTAPARATGRSARLGRVDDGKQGRHPDHIQVPPPSMWAATPSLRAQVLSVTIDMAAVTMCAPTLIYLREFKP